MARRQNLRLLVSFFAAITLYGCGGGSDDAPQPPPTGPVTLAEVESTEPATFEAVMAAYERVVAANPSLKSDNTALSRAMFEELKKPTAASANDGRATKMSALDTLTKLNRAEWRVIWMEIPASDIYPNYKTKAPAETAAVNSFRTCDPQASLEDTKADAIRHSYWNALMTRRTSAASAEKLATAHEFNAPRPAASSMDLHNNAVGRYIATKYPDATDSEILEIIKRLRFVYAGSGAVLPVEQDVLVFIADEAPFDGSFSGSLTNPDSGGPWQARFDFTQCGTVVRGQITITRGGSLQVRRFDGTIEANGSLPISISDPYRFENPSNLQFCQAMASTLNGTTSSLSGAWTSTNCRQGGFISISR
ncbi:MAG TPA: hypothetical protein PLI01_09595 [Nitrospira sp.]|nr:hypothetical protein [Nitrospira sp.]